METMVEQTLAVTEPINLGIYADRESATIGHYFEGSNTFALCTKFTDKGLRLMLVVECRDDVYRNELLLARACGLYGGTKHVEVSRPYSSKFVLDMTDYAEKRGAVIVPKYDHV